METTFSYSLCEEDYLEYFLYTSSTNSKIKAKRMRNWIMLSFAFCFFTATIFIADYQHLKVPLVIFTLATIFLYPLYEKWQYKKYYRQYIKDQYMGRLNSISDLLFTKEQIIMTDKTGESKVNKSEITEIIETGKFYYAGISTGGHIIIPKYQLDKYKELQTEMESLSANYAIPFKEKLNWKYK
jgi:YcxB-like protein